MEREAVQKRANSGIKNSQRLKEMEKEMVEQLVTQREFEQTSKYESNKKTSKVANHPPVVSSQVNLEKTTPRSARPIDSDIKKKPSAMKVPKLPLSRMNPRSRM